MLTTKSKQTLKALAHPMKPIIHVGKKAISDSLIEEIGAGLLAHGLIKIKFNESAKDEIETIINSICEQTDSELVQIQGNTATIYKKHPQKPKIKL